MVESDATATPEPTATVAPADPATEQPAPTATATPEPAPTATVEPTPTATPTPVPSPEPTQGATLQDVTDRLDGLTAQAQLGLAALLVLAIVVALTCGVYLVRAVRK